MNEQTQKSQRDKEKLERMATATLRRSARELIIAVPKAYAANTSLGIAISQSLKNIEGVFFDGMVAAHLTGRLQSVITATQKIKQVKVFGPYDEAVGFMQNRLKLKPTELARLKTIYGDTAINVTRNLGRAIETKANQAIAEGITKQTVIKIKAEQTIREISISKAKSKQAVYKITAKAKAQGIVLDTEIKQALEKITATEVRAKQAVKKIIAEGKAKQAIIEAKAKQAIAEAKAKQIVLETKAKQAMKKIIAEGMHVREGTVYLREALRASGLDSPHPWLLETLVRSQIALAYSTGRWNGNQDPVINNILWGYDYVTVGDDRVRPNHAAMDGASYPKEHPFWSENWPPNGFNCVPAGTLITTQEGQIPIENIRHGDMVFTHKQHWQPVIELHRNKGPTELVFIQLDNGLSLRGTAEHRVLTQRGWVEMTDLNIEDKICNVFSMMQQNIVANVNDISQARQSQPDNSMACSPFFAGMPNLKSDITIRQIKVNPKFSDEKIKAEFYFEVFKNACEHFFRKCHSCFSVWMTRWVKAMLPNLGFTHFLSNFGLSGRGSDFQCFRRFIGSLWMKFVIQLLRLRPSLLFNIPAFQYSAKSTVWNACFLGDVFDGNYACPILRQSGRQAARPRIFNSFFGSESICLTTDGLLSHNNSFQTTAIIPIVYNKIKRKKKIIWDSQTVYNLGVEEDESYFANGFAAHNCRCDTIEVFKDEKHKIKAVPEQVVVDGVTVLPGADVDWCYNSGIIFNDMAGSIIGR